MSHPLTAEEGKKVQRVAVYRIGHIGDMVVAIPSFWAVRRFFPNANITLFTKSRLTGTLAQSTEVLRRGPVFDDTLTYRYEGGLKGKLGLIKTLLTLRKHKIEVLVYMPTDDRSAAQMDRDEKFFRLAGIQRIVGMQARREIDYRVKESPLPWTKHETHILLDYLAHDGVVDSQTKADFNFGFSDEEEKWIEDWMVRSGLTRERPLVAVTPMSKMPCKNWPVERYQEVLRSMAKEFDPVFITFGAPSDRPVCEQVLTGLPRTYNSAGELTVRQSAALLARCKLYVGADTGVLHMAAAVETKCVGIFSARDWPGRWYPYGQGHVTFRKVVPCEGCMLEECPYDNKCMKLIQVGEVLEACRTQLGSTTP